MADQPGTYGKYAGTTSGSTPAGDDDLHSNPNQYAQGTPASNLTGSSTYHPGRQGSNDNPLASDSVSQSQYDVATPYYANPPASGGNPYSGGVPTKSNAGDDAAAAYVAGGLAATYDHLMPEQISTGGYFGNASQSNPGTSAPGMDSPYQQRLRRDEGVDDNLVPLDDRK